MSQSSWMWDDISTVVQILTISHGQYSIWDLLFGTLSRNFLIFKTGYWL